jgi:uncharacterized membrane protein
MSFTKFGVALLAYLVLDGIWLSTNSFYPKTLNTSSVARFVVGGGVAWAALAAGQAMLPEASSPGQAAAAGALFGTVVYAVYNGTEFATRADWKVEVALMDWIWGTFTGALVAWLVYLVTR